MRNQFLILPLAIAGALFLNSCGSGNAKTEENKIASAPIVTDVITVQKGKLSANFQTPGELIAYQEVDMYAKENSFVKEMRVDVGSEVTEGQLLAVLEAPELTSQMVAAQSRLKAQEANFIASKANYKRLIQTSKTPGTISPNDLDQALSKRDADSADLESAKAAYKEITQLQDYLQIKAPFTGVISARNVNVGAYVGPAGKGSEFPLFTLQQQKKLRLVISVPEAYVGYLNDQSAITFTVRALPGKTFNAKVSRIAGALDTRLRSERVEMDIDNDNKTLLPGMIAQVVIALPAKDSTFIVPKTSVVNSTEKVFVVRVKNGKADWVNVQRGRAADGKMEIYGDIAVGDTLVKTGTDEIRNGSPIKQTKVSGN